MMHVTPQWMIEQGFSKDSADRFWRRVNKTDTCWLWTAGKFSAGYGNFPKGNGTGTSEYAHRVSWMLANGPIPYGLCILHDCPIKDNRDCVNPAHLRIGTKKDNIHDAIKKGTFSKPPHRIGESNNKSKLNALKVIEIRRLWPSISQRKLAKMFHVDKSTIQAVIHMETWVHVGVPDIKPVLLNVSPLGKDPDLILHKY